MNRRLFLQTMAAGSATLALTPADLFAHKSIPAGSYFGVHPFVESHPDAVFIMRTNVDVKTNSLAIRQAGEDFGKSVFVGMTTPGIPVTHNVAIKPNIVMMPNTTVEAKGIVTDAYFVEGVIESIKRFGLTGNQFYLREVNDPGQFVNSGYTAMAERTGADLRKLDAPIGEISEDDIVWVDVPQGQWFNKIPFLRPVNAPDTWLLNIAKFKTHLMGLSLCAKNIQGAIAIQYVAHCTYY
jgi:hypothetical protein